MKNNFATLYSLMFLLLCSCGSSSSTTNIDPHSAAHSEVHQDYIDKKEQKNKNKTNQTKNADQVESTVNSLFNAVLDGQWLISEVNELKIDTENYKYKIPSLELKTAEQMAVGHDGCNNFNVGFEIKEDQIVFSEMMSTMMACKDHTEITIQVRQTLSGQTVDYQVINSQLLFLIDGNKKMFLTKLR